MRRSRTLSPWLWGVAVATLWPRRCLRSRPSSTSGSDDAPILRAFMGYEGGEPATFHLYLHTAFAWFCGRWPSCSRGCLVFHSAAVPFVGFRRS
jgi:hypothetical protein